MTFPNCLKTAIAAGMILAGSVCSAQEDVPSPDKTGGVDLRDAAVVARGMELIGSTCGGYCHGTEGRGLKAPALRNRKDLSPQSLFATISYGRKRAGKMMPGWKGVLSEADIWSTVAAVVALRNADGGGAATPNAGAH